MADTCYYAIYAVDANGNPSGDYETGLGTYSSAGVLTRTTVHKSSNSNAAVSFAAGTKYVAMTPVAAGPPFSLINTAGNLIIPSLHPGYISGNWYSCFPQRGAAGSAIPINSLRMMPFVVHQPITVSQLAARVTTIGTTNFQLGIYANNAATGRPTGNPLVKTGNIVNTALAIASAAVVANALLPPGIYWAAIFQGDSAGVYQTIAADSPGTGYLSGSATLANVNSASATHTLVITSTATFGTWPDLTSGTFAESTSAAAAMIYMKAA